MFGSKLSRILLTVIFLGIGTYAYMNYAGMLTGSTEDNIKYIRSHINSQGKLVDLEDEIDVDSVEDIKLFFGDEVEIHFGEVLLKWEKDEFLTEQTKAALAEIGIELKVNNKTNKLHLFYHGEEIKRWIK